MIYRKTAAPTYGRDKATTAGCSCCRLRVEKKKDKEEEEEEKAEINDLTFSMYLYNDIHRKTD